MIHSFKCKNFYSFNDLTEISFLVNDKAADNNGYFTTPFGDRLSKIETVIGPNASGKTNLLKVLPFLKWFIADSINSNPDDIIPVKPFAFSKDQSKPTLLSVEFETGENVYDYSVSFIAERVNEEELKYKSKTKKRITWKQVFKRSWNRQDNLYEFKKPGLFFPNEFEKLLRKNASVISVAMRLNDPKSREIASYWQKLETNIIEVGWLGDSFLPNAGKQIIETLDFYSENKPIKQLADKLLSDYDLGLDSFEIKKEKQEKGFSFGINANHNIGGKIWKMPFNYESSGTKQLFVILKTVLLVLDRGGIAVIDELDSNLHPEIVSSLVQMFIDPKTNSKNAQLLFCNHSLLVLNRLDKYQIILTEKNKFGATEAWRLDEMTGIRADENYFAKYIAGAYGAMPKLDK